MPGPYVFGGGDHTGHGSVGKALAVVVTVALLPEADFNLLHTITVAGVEPEQFPNHEGFRFVNDQSAPSFT